MDAGGPSRQPATAPGRDIPITVAGRSRRSFDEPNSSQFGSLDVSGADCLASRRGGSHRRSSPPACRGPGRRRRLFRKCIRERHPPRKGEPLPYGISQRRVSNSARYAPSESPRRLEPSVNPRRPYFIGRVAPQLKLIAESLISSVRRHDLMAASSLHAIPVGRSVLSAHCIPAAAVGARTTVSAAIGPKLPTGGHLRLPADGHSTAESDRPHRCRRFAIVAYRGT